jgi:hypothetical protein
MEERLMKIKVGEIIQKEERRYEKEISEKEGEEISKGEMKRRTSGKKMG